MRILVLASTVRSYGNDTAPSFINDLCEALSNHHSIVLLTQHNPGEPLEETQTGFTIKRYRYAPESLELLSSKGGLANTLRERPVLSILVPFFLFSQIVSIWRENAELKPEVIHAHWIFPQGFCAVVARALSFHKPDILLTSHGGDLYGLRGALFKRIKGFTINNADRLAVVSRAMKQYVGRSNHFRPGKVDVCPMGANLDTVFVPDNSVTRSDCEILCVGRLVPKKGFDRLLEALPEIRKNLPGVRVTIVGDGPMRPALEQIIISSDLSDCVAMTGAKNHRELVHYYQRCSVAIFPFVQASDGDMEGLGLVVIEAMGCAAPVIVGDVPAVHDIIPDQSVGIVCNTENRREIVKETLDLLQNPGKRRALGEAGRRHVEQSFSWPVCANRYDQIFREFAKATLD